ncbi:MAG TPA: rRNA pseudouridine synthase [Gallionellaceae bacterium]|nr:rRNA pseudouridine synthase [Gallionellaceae bacterium]
MTDTIRLAKLLAGKISCSRSEAEKYIENGFVTVDGIVVEEPGSRVKPDSKIELLAGAKPVPVEPVTILLHKPAGYDIEKDHEAALRLITPENQAADDRSGIRFIKRHLADLNLTDPLGVQSSGLVILTQDWRVARKLITDAAKVEQEFIVDVAGEILPEGLALLNQGIRINGSLLPVKASWQNETRLRFAVKGNQRHQIASMCERAGLTVLAMKRIRIGRIPLSALQAGQWRYLLGYEKF